MAERSTRRLLPLLAAASLCGAAAAQPSADAAAEPASAASAPVGRPLRPLTLDSIAPALERPIGEPIAAPTTSGAIELHGKRFYIAEYLLLFETGGEIVAPTRNGRIFGQRQGAEQVALVYSSTPDIVALQALVDRAWTDLNARLTRAGVVVSPAEKIVREYGAVYAATDEPSTPSKLVVVEAKNGDSLRRYLALAPSGMKLVPRGATGIGLGNLSARLSYPARGVEAVSLAMAVNLSGMDGSAERVSSFDGSDEPTISPVLEVVPAPRSALVHAHAQLSLVNLTEALQLAGEFGRFRRAPPVPLPIPPNDPLRLLGRTLDGVVSQILGVPSHGRGPVTGADGETTGAVAARKRVDAVFELDGPAMSRMMLYGVSAANQAIADSLRTAQLSFQQQMAVPPAVAPSR